MSRGVSERMPKQEALHLLFRSAAFCRNESRKELQLSLQRKQIWAKKNGAQVYISRSFTRFDSQQPGLREVLKPRSD